jgi:DNA-binding NarL/FixJ family response regulator
VFLEGRKTVLTIWGKDEDPGVENLLKRLSAELPDLDHVQLKHGPNLIESIRNIGPQLIVFDISGRIAHFSETLQNLKQHFRSVPIFALVDNYSCELERKVLLLGISTVFSKESDEWSLIQNIRAVLPSIN